MGAIKEIKLADKFEMRQQLWEQMRIIYEPELQAIGLDVERIKEQNLEELRRSLELINDAISHPETFGVTKIRMTASTGIMITTINQDAHFEIGILPLLLERKQLILERIRLLQGEEKIENIKDLVDKVSDESIRTKLQEEIENLQKEATKIEEQEEQVEQIRVQELFKREAELAKIEMFERRSRVWLSFLERESVATIVGSVLLILLVVAQLIAMFAGTQTSEIVNNAFLIILGYFFGQSASRTQGNLSS